MIVTVTSEQTIFDVCLRQYGDLENLFDLINLSKIDSVVSDVNGFVFDNTTIEKNYVTQYYDKYLKKIGNKPIEFVSVLSGNYIVQEDGFKILQEDGSGILHI